MKRLWPALVLLPASFLVARDRIAEIEFFGYKGVDVDAVRNGNGAEEQPSPGYRLPKEPREIAALVHASRDPDDGVRDDATRALLEMAQAGPAIASQIPLDT